MVTEEQKANLRRPSREEARELGSMGGKKRAENIKKRKKLKEELLALLMIEQSNGKTIQENWVMALAKNLLKGDVKTSIFVRDTIGERPTGFEEADDIDDSIELRIVGRSKIDAERVNKLDNDIFKEDK